MNDSVINFRLAKKNIHKKRKEAQAQENRVKFGRTKEEKKLERFEKDKIHKNVDSSKLTPEND